MAGPVTIQPATLKDTSYVCSWLRPDDEREALSQTPEGIRRDVMGYYLLQGGDAFSARVDGQPIAIFGTGPISVCTLSVWALGTRHMWRAITAMNRFLVDVHLPDRIAQGFHSMEARALADHGSATAWLESMGGVQHGPPFVFGRSRETFLLYRWTDLDLQRIKTRVHKITARIEA